MRHTRAINKLKTRAAIGHIRVVIAGKFIYVYVYEKIAGVLARTVVHMWKSRACARETGSYIRRKFFSIHILREHASSTDAHTLAIHTYTHTRTLIDRYNCVAKLT